MCEAISCWKNARMWFHTHTQQKDIFAVLSYAKETLLRGLNSWVGHGVTYEMRYHLELWI